MDHISGVLLVCTLAGRVEVKVESADCVAWGFRQAAMAAIKYSVC